MSKKPVLFTLAQFRASRRRVKDALGMGRPGYRYQMHANDKHGVDIVDEPRGRFSTDAWGVSYRGKLAYVEERLWADCAFECYGVTDAETTLV